MTLVGQTKALRSWIAHEKRFFDELQESSCFIGTDFGVFVVDNKPVLFIHNEDKSCACTVPMTRNLLKNLKREMEAAERQTALISKIEGKL